MSINVKNLSDLQLQARINFEAIDRGDILLPGFLRPCRLKILMVVDGYPGSFLNVSFGHSYFGLSAVVAALQSNPEWWVKFDITKAHRQTDPLGAADMEGFRFTQGGFNINNYDQVWLFGARTDDGERLTDAELEVLARWMDQGGGLLAMGDHADLGASLCSRVPRARSMRKWTNAQGVPQPNGPDRHDTLLKGHDSFYTFNDESDDQPMKTTVRKYPLWGFSPFFHRSMPHPVLCGANGVIDILPDHPHEGEVIEPTNLGQNFSFGAYVNKPEYPTVGANQPAPEIIAWAHVQGDHTEGRGGAAGTDRNKGPANTLMFGAIGAYNGHAANVGRVVVDSTWHHWFDVNLIGRPLDSPIDPPTGMVDPKALGFLATPAGLAAWERIKNYYRNVAMWLASPAKQSCMFMHATWGGVLRYPLVEQLHPKLPLWELGGYARDAIGRRAGQCTITEWVRVLFPVEISELLKRRPAPCLTCPPFEMIELYTLGGIVREMLTLVYASRAGKGEVDEKALARAMVAGSEIGIKEFLTTHQESLKHTQALMKRLEPNFRVVAKAEMFVHAHKEQKATAVRKKPTAKKTTRAKPRKK